MRDFARNLKSGARLSLGLPIDRLDFRVSVGQLIALFVLSMALDFVGDFLRAPIDSVLDIGGALQEGYYAALLLLIAALLSLLYRQSHLALALPVVLLSAEPLLQIGNWAYGLAIVSGAAPHWLQSWGFVALVAWMLFTTWRAVATVLSPRRPRYWVHSLGGAAAIAAAVWLSQSLLPSEPWWQAGDEASAEDTSLPSPLSEEVLATQPDLLSDALDKLADERPHTTDLYFVAFAPYAAQDVFRKEAQFAVELFDRRFDTKGRSIALINNRMTLLDTPMASVSNLRDTLNEIGQTIDADDDVVMLYITSHGSADHRIAVELPPYDLQQLSPALLSRLLKDAGIKWRILVVSACYSGGFVEPLKDDYTLIMTASQSDRQSFGCSNDADFTYFGEALLNHALRYEDSFLKAFDMARARVAQREREEKQSPPSDPQLFIGEAMTAKLKSLERAIRERRGSTRTI